MKANKFKKILKVMLLFLLMCVILCSMVSVCGIVPGMSYRFLNSVSDIEAHTNYQETWYPLTENYKLYIRWEDPTVSSVTSIDRSIVSSVQIVGYKTIHIWPIKMLIFSATITAALIVVRMKRRTETDPAS